MKEQTGHSRGATALRSLKQGFPLAAGAACLWLLTHELAALDVVALRSAFSQIAPVQWALAALATLASFWAVGRYDAVLHRHFHTRVPLERAVRGGAVAIAFSQTVGFGLVTGSFARWRSLPDVPLKTAAALTALCAVSFLVALAFVTALICLFLQPGSALWATPTALALLALPAYALMQPDMRLPFGVRLRLPSLVSMGAIAGLTFLDTLFAGLALYLLLPDGTGLAFTLLLPVFLIALGAGIASGSPAGLGAFELTLFALLPHIPKPELAAGILGFRLIYYALPAALAGLALMLPAKPASRNTRVLRPHQSAQRLMAYAKRAELGVARQNGARVIHSDTGGGFAVTTPQTLTLLFDPASGPASTLIDTLKHRARALGRIPALYKCSARTALEARQAGFKLAHIADEALIDPQTFSLDGSEMRQLRRKLRQADKAGVSISAPSRFPLPDMAAIDADWQARNKGARGLSMGQFCPAYVAQQRLYLAYQGERLVGFVSFHVSAHELCLDLMRLAADAPQGTMHALVAQAIENAARAGRTRLSLAALPARTSRSWAGAQLGKLIAQLSGSAGLAQFKDSFAPRYAPLYMAAPSHLGLGIAMVDMALAISRASPPERLPANMHVPHYRHDSYEFA